MRQLTPGEIYRSCIARWGHASQIGMMYEEMAELICALNKFNRNPSDETRKNVCEEIADVEVMMGQARLIFGDDTTETIKQYKLARLQLRLNQSPLNRESEAKGK